MREIKMIVASNSALPTMYSEGWELKAIYENVMYFDREIKKSRTQKKAEMTPQYLQFKTLYPKATGITGQDVINKIDTIVKAGEFDALMAGIEQFNKKIFLEKITPKFIPHASTFLNGRRWVDKFDIMENRIPVADKWMIPYLEKITPQQGEKVMKMKKDWELKQKREITEGTFKNIVDFVLGVNQ